MEYAIGVELGMVDKVWPGYDVGFLVDAEVGAQNVVVVA